VTTGLPPRPGRSQRASDRGIAGRSQWYVYDEKARAERGGSWFVWDESRKIIEGDAILEFQSLLGPMEF